MSYFQDKRVCVTGAGGSIGSELCEQLLELGAQVVAVCRSEESLYRLGYRLSQGGDHNWIGILGSITDYDLMRATLRDCDIVINAAAHKHVPICERNPVEAVDNNIFGMQTLLRAAGNARFVQISTDKAVKPKSIMGMTKRVCEMLLEGTSTYDASVVRFGNVLESSGSVLPLWREQLKRGEQITLTDKRCTRYFMTIPDACKLVLKVTELGCWWAARGPFVLEMGEPQSLYEMALAMALGDKSKIRITGLRPGEKLTEELFHGGQLHTTPALGIMQVAEPDAQVKAADWFDLVNSAADNDGPGVRRALTRITR